MNITFKTAESVCEGHPDKLCDKIADAILDAYLFKDKGARVAVEVMAVGPRIIVAGEISYIYIIEYGRCFDCYLSCSTFSFLLHSR